MTTLVYCYGVASLLQTNSQNLIPQLLYYIGHDINCNDPVRNVAYSQITKLLSEFESLHHLPQHFLHSEADLQKLLLQLPLESHNLMINRDLGEKEHLITRESVSEMWAFWKESLPYRTGLQHIFGSVDKQIRRFSLNLGYLFALEAFLASRATFLLTFEDDAHMRSDFKECLLSVLSILPPNWDLFSFVTPHGQQTGFKPYLQVNSSPISVSFQVSSSAALLWSRTGARKVLHRYLFEVDNYDLGDPNGDMNIDSLIYNLSLLPPFDGPSLRFSLNYQKDRNFQTYSYIPSFDSPVTQDFTVTSTWQ
jgi:hypothetical protein